MHYIQPKKKRKRKSKSTGKGNLHEGWNDAINNISSEPVTDVEEKLFLKGKKRVGGLGHHYGGGGGGDCAYEDISITIIEQVEKKTFEFLADRECYWQHQLRVYVQNGGKAHCYRKDIGR